MRLFAAIQLSEELKASITGKLHEFKKNGVRGDYVPTQNLHLTLSFIGELKDASAVKAAMQNIKFKPFRLSLSDMGTSGDTLWVGVKGNQGLNGLARDIREALDSAGIAYDKEKFVPHIPIIRKVTGNWKIGSFPRGEMMVNKISLMKSETKDGKHVCTEIFSI